MFLTNKVDTVTVKYQVEMKILYVFWSAEAASVTL
uniref:Uncharacterized protein n=1 Tax=Arundo donax TaxID=35708 RepID=A0A0A9BJT5_ARUDO